MRWRNNCLVYLTLFVPPLHECLVQVTRILSSAHGYESVRRRASLESSNYADTGNGVKWIIQGLTSFSNLFLPNVDVPQRVYQKTELSPSDVLSGVIGDFENGYLFSGQIDSEMYDEDCVFTDPTLSFRGLSTFERNIKAIKPALDIFVGDSLAVLYDCNVDTEAKEVKAIWRMSGAIKLPWKPRIELTGNTVLSYDTDRGGRIVDYYERWDLPAVKALSQLLQPSKIQINTVKLEGSNKNHFVQDAEEEISPVKTINVKKLKSIILDASGIRNTKTQASAMAIADAASNLIRASSVRALNSLDYEESAAAAVRDLGSSSWDLLYTSIEEKEETDFLEKVILQTQGSPYPALKFTDLESIDGSSSSIITTGPFSIQLALSCFQPSADKASLLIQQKRLKVFHS
jgi:Uncharacterized conserved protein (DUF2358)